MAQPEKTLDLGTLLSKRAARAPANKDTRGADRRAGIVAAVREIRQAKTDEEAADAFLDALDLAKE